MKYLKQSHCVYHCCEYHLVFATKCRRKIFNSGIFAYMQDPLKEVNEHYPSLDILEINHDHIHMLISIPSKMKSNTSRDLKKRFLFLKDLY